MRVPDKISTINVAGKEIRRDEAGFLVDPDDWTPEVAEFLAAEIGVELSDEHFVILNFMRDYLEEHQVAADARLTYRFMAKHDGTSTNEARKRFYKLFPYGYVQQACKISGMRQPRVWSTG